MLLETFDEGNQVVTRATCLTPHTIGSIAEGSLALTVRDPTGFANGNPILVAGAGPEGAHLVTTIASVAGHVLTLAAVASATVSRVTVGKPTNPSTVVFTDRHRDADPVAYTHPNAAITNPSTGIWELRRINDEGDWTVHFQGTGTCHCAGVDDYRVKRARALA